MFKDMMRGYVTRGFLMAFDVLMRGNKWMSPKARCLRVAKQPVCQRQSNLHDMPTAHIPADNPFQPGTMVVLTLGTPREKFWGALLALAPEGISIRGIELASFDDLVSLVKENEPYAPGVVFFPMHRVERMELDLPDGTIPSLSQRFTTRTGLDPVTVLARSSPEGPR
jgi:hypothetical protein